MSEKDRRKQSLYFSDTMLDEIRSEAARMDRSLSWVVQKAWRFARGRIMATLSANDPTSNGTTVENDAVDPTVGVWSGRGK